MDHDTNQNVSEKEDALKKIVNINNFQILADSFKQLGDSNRLRIFWLLCHCEENVINISEIVKMSSPAVSHHLKQLKASHLICSRRDGKEMFYSASNNAESQLLHKMIEELMEINCPEWY